MVAGENMAVLVKSQRNELVVGDVAAVSGVEPAQTKRAGELSQMIVAYEGRLGHKINIRQSSGQTSAKRGCTFVGGDARIKKILPFV